MQPLVSIIIPVYQVSDYVERCLNSVLNQTYKNIECILVDDATKDDSIEKCERIIRDYQGSISFNLLHHENNRGLSAARNTGTNAATGEYLFYLDSDDEITPDCIEKLIAYVLEDNSLEMVQGRYQRKGDGIEALGKSDNVKILSNEEARYQFLERRTLNYTVWNKLLKRSFIIDNQLYNKEGIINEDLLWTFYLIKHLDYAQLCEGVTYYYHSRPDSLLSGRDPRRRGLSYVVIFDEILHNLTPGDEKSELKGFHTTFCAQIANYYRCVPELKRVLQFYLKQARMFGCWKVYLTVSMAGLICHFVNPINVFKRLYSLLY